MREAEALARLRLARTDGIGPVRFRDLLAHFDGSAEAALQALPAWAAKRNKPFHPPSPAEVRREYDTVLGAGGTFLHWDEPGYPPLLGTIDDPPTVLAVLGDPALLLRRQVAVVGARNASAGGLRIAGELAEALAKAGVVVTSGLARGVDAAAHEGALRAAKPGGASTVAVLPGGLDVTYPPENAALQARIAEGGAIVSEAPLRAQPTQRHFPRRNRIVAGLSLGVVLVEAALGSGTLITARLAAEMGRDVFAVPGSPLDPRCRGSNDLLRQGATLCETAADVLNNLPEAPRAGAAGPLFEARPAPPTLAQRAARAPEATGDAAQLLELLGPSPVAVDEVLRRCHLSPSAAQALLLDLELSGQVEVLPGNRIVRSAAGDREGIQEPT
ncbi:DNA-processing protein DprA [Roseomonas elaeocarpi]|uniref:DNA-processing protein DprA n=1 Tax=Roseomonas elaeocarpi TaxID=907779 RepID=A0ABV6JY00_9PROT